MSGAGFGVLVSRTRKEQSLSLRQPADIALITPESLERLEAGERDPGRRLARDLGRALNLGYLPDTYAAALHRAEQPMSCPVLAARAHTPRELVTG